mgnify:CR=1 FL=1
MLKICGKCHHLATTMLERRLIEHAKLNCESFTKLIIFLFIIYYKSYVIQIHIHLMLPDTMYRIKTMYDKATPIQAKPPSQTFIYMLT